LDGEVEDIEFNSLRQVKELFFQFKNIYRYQKKDIQDYGSTNIQKDTQDRKTTSKDL